MERLIGQKLPDLAFQATLADAAGSCAISPARIPGRVVLYLYPYTGRREVPDPPDWDDIPGAHGSTPQAAGFAALDGDYRAAGVTVLGLSGQSPQWQAEFAARLSLPFALLSDPPLMLARALPLPTFSTGDVTYLRRLTLVLRDGVITDVVYPVANPGAHAAELLERVAKTAR